MARYFKDKPKCEHSNCEESSHRCLSLNLGLWTITVAACDEHTDSLARLEKRLKEGKRP